MRVHVRLFAEARRRVGPPEVALDLPDGATVADLKRELAKAFPELAPILGRVRIAIDSEYAEEDQFLPPGAKVAIIPPVSGGGA